MTTPRTVAEVVSRVHAGEPVEPLDLATAEAAERLATITADVEAARAAKAREEADRIEAERLMDDFATEADALNARIIVAMDTLDAAVTEVNAVRDDMDRVIREYLDALRPLGVHLTRDNLDVKTNGRIRLNPGQLGRSVIKVPASQDYVRWLKSKETNR